MNKKILSFLFVLVFIVAVSYSATITVTNPHGGENWVIGNTYTIRWNSSGISGTVGIKLFQNGRSLGYIAQNVPNTGSYNWTIGNIIGVGPISAGAHYQIQVKKSGVAAGLSAGEFTISNPPTASITVTNPHGGENWVIGNTYTIRWSSSGISGTVGIKLFQNGRSLGYIAQNVPNTGSYSWTIGNIIGVGPISAGSHYQIQVKKSGVTAGLSAGEFTITNSQQQTATITVNSPHSGDTWCRGKTYTIKWNGTMAPNVKILLYKNNNKLLAITDATLNKGSYDWAIPTNLTPSRVLGGPGEYFIRIQSTDGTAYGDSKPFKINVCTSNKFTNTPTKINPQIVNTEPRPDFVVYDEFLYWEDWDNKIVKYQIKVKNKGNKDATNIPVRLDIYRRGNPGVTETFRDTIASLPKGIFIFWEKEYKVEKIGTYDFTFKVNPNYSIKESVYTNNTARRKTIGRGVYPDLVVTWVSGYFNIFHSNFHHLEAIIENIGQKASPATKLKVYIEGKGGEILDVPSLKPSEKYRAVTRREYEFHVHTLGKCEKVWVEAIVDPFRTVKEELEKNNFLSKGVLICCLNDKKTKYCVK